MILQFTCRIYDRIDRNISYFRVKNINFIDVWSNRFQFIYIVPSDSIRRRACKEGKRNIASKYCFEILIRKNTSARVIGWKQIRRVRRFFYWKRVQDFRRRKKSVLFFIAFWIFEISIPRCDRFRKKNFLPPLKFSRPM